jgi:hypothetical protein
MNHFPPHMKPDYQGPVEDWNLEFSGYWTRNDGLSGQLQRPGNDRPDCAFRWAIPSALVTRGTDETLVIPVGRVAQVLRVVGMTDSSNFTQFGDEAMMHLEITPSTFSLRQE